MGTVLKGGEGRVEIWMQGLRIGEAKCAEERMVEGAKNRFH